MADEKSAAAQSPAPPAAAPAAPTPVVADPTQVRQVKEFKHNRPLFASRIDPSGRFVCTGAHDKLVARWDVDGDKKLEFAGHESWVRGMAFQPGGELLLTGDYTGRLAAWRYAAEPAQPPVYTIEAHKGWVRAVAFSPDGATVATCGNDKLVRLWSASDGKLVRELAGHESHVYNVVFHPAGGNLASCDLKGVVKHWDVTTGMAVRQLDASVLWKYDPTFKADIGGARGMAFSPDGAWLAASGITEVSNAFAGIGFAVIALFDWASGERKQVLRPKENFQGVAWAVAFHPAGFIMAVGGGGGGGALWFFKPDQPNPFFEFKLPNNARDLALHPDGLRLAIAHFDNTLRLYDMSPKPAA
ncbi:MAG TPA: WD40 repeat domain-containing protein [Pirellulales bacterium]|nr:WD40 repeat domain-containing protein [Pirellulales bacterium]